MATPVFKSFITEKEINEVKKKRQEEWEKVRRPDQPLGKLGGIDGYPSHNLALLCMWPMKSCQL